MNMIKLKDATIRIEHGPRGVVVIKVNLGIRRSFFKSFPQGLSETSIKEFVKMLESAT